LDVLAERFLAGRANADWLRIYTRSVVSEERDGTRFLHDLLSQALQDRERRDRPELYRDVHRELFKWHANRCAESDPKAITEQHERFFLAAVRHLSKFDEREAVEWANAQMQRFNEAARWRALEEACSIVLPIAERTFGAEHECTTANVLWLAGVYRDTGRYVEAGQLYDRVRAIDEKTLGPEHPDFATTLHCLASVYRDTGRYGEAEQLYDRVRAIREKTLGPEHPDFAMTLYDLAGVYRNIGRYAEAEQLYDRVRAIEEKTLGPEHPSFATTLTNLAGV
jgi:tetratricopeptide (TPR) repeat protein